LYPLLSFDLSLLFIPHRKAINPLVCYLFYSEETLRNHGTGSVTKF
jgi:hypothetical protein